MFSLLAKGHFRTEKDQVRDWHSPGVATTPTRAETGDTLARAIGMSSFLFRIVCFVFPHLVITIKIVCSSDTNEHVAAYRHEAEVLHHRLNDLEDSHNSLKQVVQQAVTVVRLTTHRLRLLSDQVRGTVTLGAHRGAAYARGPPVWGSH